MHYCSKADDNLITDRIDISNGDSKKYKLK